MQSRRWRGRQRRGREWSGAAAPPPRPPRRKASRATRGAISNPVSEEPRPLSDIVQILPTSRYCGTRVRRQWRALRAQAGRSTRWQRSRRRARPALAGDGQASSDPRCRRQGRVNRAQGDRRFGNAAPHHSVTPREKPDGGSRGGQDRRPPPRPSRGAIRHQRDGAGTPKIGIFPLAAAGQPEPEHPVETRAREVVEPAPGLVAAVDPAVSRIGETERP